MFTILFVDSAAPRIALSAELARILGGAMERSSISAGDVEVDVRRNPDSDPAAVARDPTDYLAYPVSIEIEGRDSMPLAQYLESVGRVMRALHERGCSVVAACDWEDDLPGGGKLGAVFERTAREPNV